MNGYYGDRVNTTTFATLSYTPTVFGLRSWHSSTGKTLYSLSLSLSHHTQLSQRHYLGALLPVPARPQLHGAYFSILVLNLLILPLRFHVVRMQSPGRRSALFPYFADTNDAPGASLPSWPAVAVRGSSAVGRVLPVRARGDARWNNVF